MFFSGFKYRFFKILGFTTEKPKVDTISRSNFEKLVITRGCLNNIF